MKFRVSLVFFFSLPLFFFSFGVNRVMAGCPAGSFYDGGDLDQSKCEGGREIDYHSFNCLNNSYLGKPLPPGFKPFLVTEKTDYGVSAYCSNLNICGDGNLNETINGVKKECDDGKLNGSPGDKCDTVCKLVPQLPQFVSDGTDPPVVTAYNLSSSDVYADGVIAIDKADANNYKSSDKEISGRVEKFILKPYLIPGTKDSYQYSLILNEPVFNSNGDLKNSLDLVLLSAKTDDPDKPLAELNVKLPNYFSVDDQEVGTGLSLSEPFPGFGQLASLISGFKILAMNLFNFK